MKTHISERRSAPRYPVDTTIFASLDGQPPTKRNTPRADLGIVANRLDTCGVRAVEPVPVEMFANQLRALLSDIETFMVNADLVDVDRIGIEARAAYQGGGWYGLDDLTFRTHEGYDDLGDELDVVVTRPITDCLTLLTKAAVFNGVSGGRADIWRWWLQLTYHF